MVVELPRPVCYQPYPVLIGVGSRVVQTFRSEFSGSPTGQKGKTMDVFQVVAWVGISVLAGLVCYRIGVNRNQLKAKAEIENLETKGKNWIARMITKIRALF